MESWSWEEINNSTDTTYVNSDLCENVTNHWLYFVFTGYLLPLLSPRVRDWIKETINSLKSNKIAGELVTLTEYGFNKIQDIQDDKEMKDFIKRVCKSRRPGLLIQEKIYDKLSEEFSGKGGGKSWRYLINIIDNSHNIGTEFARP
tara:strand:+ start:657 stop:1094 length:438 start_codon:yes stop_codon:yes gene_type:complete